MKKIKLFKVLLSLLTAFLLMTGLSACSMEVQWGSAEGSPSGSVQSADTQDLSQTADGQSAEGVDSSKVSENPSSGGSSSAELSESGSYTTKEDVALYIHTYGHLPDNFITKKEAEKLGWTGGSVEKYAPGKCIGGTHFGNYEGRLPEKNGRSYTECDINTLGASSRGAERIVFSNDGLIYYTGDHYENFELLYGVE